MNMKSLDGLTVPEAIDRLCRLAGVDRRGEASNDNPLEPPAMEIKLQVRVKLSGGGERMHSPADEEYIAHLTERNPL